MSERPGGGLTPGDPLGGSSPQRQSDGLWSGTPGYTTPAPPGAGGPQPSVPAEAGGRPVLSGWWRRVGAQLIDGTIIFVGALIILGILGALGLSVDSNGGAVALIVAALIAVFAITVVAFLYAPILMSRTNGQTLGRMALGIRVIRADGGPMTFWFAMLREVVVKALLVGVISSATFGLASVLDALWPLWDEENRALHDLVVNTRVIRT
jgi:uncharacterized RDD family membrane protein YckC